MIKKLLSLTLISLLLIGFVSRANAQSTPAQLVYVTESGIYATDDQSSPPKTLVGWVRIVGRTDCASVSVSPRGRFLAAIHPFTDIEPGFVLDLVRLPDASQSRKVIKELLNNTALKDGSSSDIACDNRPAWSADGTHIAFRSQHETAHPALYVFNISAVKPRQLAMAHIGDDKTILPPGTPYLSPDAKYVIYNDENPVPFGDESVYVVPTDGSSDPLPLYDGKGSGQLLTLDWISTRDLVTTHSTKDCLTNYRLSEIPARSSRLLFNGCALSSAFDDVQNTWLINVSSWGTREKKDTTPGLYLFDVTGKTTRIDSLSSGQDVDKSVRVQWEPVSQRFIVFNAQGADTVDPVSGEVKPYTLPGGVAFPADAVINVAPDGSATVFATHDGVWLVDPGGSAAPLISDPPADNPQGVQLAWSPTSKALYAIRKSGLWLYTKGGQAALITPGAIASAEWTVQQ